MDWTRILSIWTLLCFACTYSEDRFIVLQFNDVLGQLESFKKGSNPPEPIQGDNAIGGLSKLVGELKYHEKAASNEDTILRISSGNMLGGFNGWLATFGFKQFGEIVKNFHSFGEEPSSRQIYLQGYGMKEFETGLRQTSKYIAASGFENKPIITNADCSGEELDLGSAEKEFCGHDGQKFFDTSRIIQIGDTKVGVVGFVNPLAMNLSDPGNVPLRNPVESIRNILNKDELKDIKTVIAIGGGSYDIAKRILDGVPKVQLVLYAGGSEHRAYPEVYNSKFIAASSKLKFGAAIGKLTFKIREDGRISLVQDSGNGIIPLVDRQDEKATKLVNELSKSEDMIEAKKEIGKTLVRLKATREACWRSECNMGNLIADSMVHCGVNALYDYSGIKKEDLADLFSVWHSGSLMNDVVEPHGSITGLHVHAWLPYHNNATLVRLKGSDLKLLFEESGKGIIAQKDDSIKDWGGFMQVSDGVEVRYNDAGKLLSLKVWHSEDQIPTLMDVKNDKVYHLVMGSTLFRGRSVYGFLKNKFVPFPSGVKSKSIDFDDNCLERYIRAMGVLKSGFQERIHVGDKGSGGGSGGGKSREGDGPGNCPSQSKGTALTVFLTLLIFLIIVGSVYGGWKFVWPMIQNRRRTSSWP